MKTKRDKAIAKAIVIFTALYLIFFALVAFFYHNYEFMFYSFIMAVLIVFAIIYNKQLNLNILTIILLVILLMLHALGCNIYLSGIKLYDTWFIPGILKYDNIVHFFGGVVAAFLVYYWLVPNLSKAFVKNKIFLFIALIIAAMGLASFNELSEYSAVVLFNNTDVGDYKNNSLDFFFNFLGSSITLLYLIIRMKVRK